MASYECGSGALDKRVNRAREQIYAGQQAAVALPAIDRTSSFPDIDATRDRIYVGADGRVYAFASFLSHVFLRGQPRMAVPTKLEMRRSPPLVPGV
jgi:hypothetical protein